jgi:hypothetical protein
MSKDSLTASRCLHNTRAMLYYRVVRAGDLGLDGQSLVVMMANVPILLDGANT